jgi:hypothetical protein
MLKTLSMIMAVVFLGVSVVPQPLLAMEIYKFDKMADADQADYLTVLIDGAQKVLIEGGMDNEAAKVHKLFTEKLPGDAAPLGMIEFDRNLDRARVADLQRFVKDPKATRLEVEHAMIVTLKKNGIVLPTSFMHVADSFKPKHPPKSQ